METLSLLTIKEVTVIGLLVCACAFLIKANKDSLKKIELERKEIELERKKAELKREEAERKREEKREEMDHKRDIEAARAQEEIKEMRVENKVERREWLGALKGNTDQLGNIAQKMEVIPRIKEDIESIKGRMKSMENEANIKRIMEGANKNE